MKIKLGLYNPQWVGDFNKIKIELTDLLGSIKPKIEHIGSTSVEGLSAKQIIDILVGVNEEADMDKTISPLTRQNYVYYQKFNEDTPYRRFFVKHKLPPQDLSIPIVVTCNDEVPASTMEHSARLAHIHVLPHESVHWLRHIAFRDYLRTHPAIRELYQKLKEELSEREWVDGNEYNAAKNEFIKDQEAKAIAWYRNR